MICSKTDPVPKFNSVIWLQQLTVKFWSVSYKRVLILPFQKTWNILHELYGAFSSRFYGVCLSFLKLKSKIHLLCSTEGQKWRVNDKICIFMQAIPCNLGLNHATHLQLFPLDKEYFETQFCICETKKSMIQTVKDKNAGSIKSSCEFRFFLSRT